MIYYVEKGSKKKEHNPGRSNYSRRVGGMRALDSWKKGGKNVLRPHYPVEFEIDKKKKEKRKDECKKVNKKMGEKKKAKNT